MRDITREELAQLRQSFDRCDTNSDGWIGHSEFDALLKALDHDLSDDECLLAFEVADDDGDGLISFEEFMEWWTE
jgi:Ca2+-binding EF-hand superfamily protein